MDNHAILVIDDNPQLHNDFRTILERKLHAKKDLDELYENLTGIAAGRVIQGKTYQIHSAYQGEEGLDLVKKAVEEGKPFDFAFVDMRMPPGWDGLETIEQLWKADPNLPVVICTAYSDYTYDQIYARISPSDNLLILKKPFDIAEVEQIAHFLTEKKKLQRSFSEHKEKDLIKNHFFSYFLQLFSQHLERRLDLAGVSSSFIQDVLTSFCKDSPVFDVMEKAVGILELSILQLSRSLTWLNKTLSCKDNKIDGKQILQDAFAIFFDDENKTTAISLSIQGENCKLPLNESTVLLCSAFCLAFECFQNTKNRNVEKLAVAITTVGKIVNLTVTMTPNQIGLRSFPRLKEMLAPIGGNVETGDTATVISWNEE